MRTPIAAAMIAACAATSACGRDHGADAGPSVTRGYQVGNFDRVEVAGPYDVQVRTGARVGVRAQGSEKLLDHTVVEVQGGRLLIHPEKRSGVFQFVWSSNGKAAFVVTVPMLRGAAISGSGGIAIDRITGDRFEGQVAGSGNLDLGALDVGTLKLGIAGSGDTTARSGKAQSAEYEIAGSGGLDARAVSTDKIKVSIAGSGSVQAQAKRVADVDIKGSGDVTVKGGAKCNVSKAGSGNVHCS